LGASTKCLEIECLVKGKIKTETSPIIKLEVTVLLLKAHQGPDTLKHQGADFFVLEVFKAGLSGAELVQIVEKLLHEDKRRCESLKLVGRGNKGLVFH
jgi:hypothetical protein